MWAGIVYGSVCKCPSKIEEDTGYHEAGITGEF